MLTVSGAPRSRWVPGGGYFVKRFLKWAAGVILVLVLLLALAAAGIRYFLSSEQLIEIVQARGEETLGRKVRLRSLSVGLFSLEAEGLSVGGGKEEGGGKKTPLIEVEEIDILFDPTALLYNRLNLLQVELRGVWVRASRDAGGRFSFQDIIDRLGAAGAGRVFLPPDKTGVASSSIFSPRTAEAAEEGAAQGMGGDDFDVVIRSLEIEDAKLFFESAAFNGQPAFRLSCVFERVEAGTLRVGSPIEAGLQGRCAEPGDLLLQADLRADLPGRSFSVSAKFDVSEIEPFARLAPAAESFRALRGVVKGKADLSYSPEAVARWSIDLAADNLSGELRLIPGGGWRPLRLSKAALRSEGSYDLRNEAAEISRLEVDLPFLKARMPKGGRWNLSGRDEVEVNLEMPDLGEVLRIAAPLLGFSAKGFKEGAKVELVASASREREKGPDFFYSVSAAFDPVNLAPIARLAYPIEGIRGLGGRVGGKVQLSFSPEEVARWEVDVAGKSLSGQLRLRPRERWRRVRLAEVSVRSAGSYDLRRDTGEVSRLEVDLPFGSLRLPKGGSWNVSGRDEAEIDLAVSNLASAFSALGPVMGPVAGGLRPQGTLQVSLSIRRDRKPAKVSILGTAETNLKRVHLTDYPNLEIRGSGKVAFGKRGAQVSLPRLSAHDRRRPEAAPALRLEAVSATLSQQGLMEGRITSREVRVRSMSFRGSMDPAGKSTLDGLLEKRRKAAKKSAPARPGSAGPGPPSAGKAAKPSPGSSKPPPAGAGGRRAPLPAERPVTEFPEVKIGKVEIDNLDVNFRDEVEKGKPPVIVDWKGLRFSAKNINTRMPAQRRDTRVHLYQPPKGDPKVFPLDLQARMNLGVIPLSVKGNFNLRQFDLRPFSPYARKAQKIEIRRGTLKLDSEFNIRRNYIIATADAVVFGLALKSIGKNDPRKAVRLLTLNFLKKEKGEIPVRVRVEGRLDDPSFNLAEAAVASLLVNVVDTVLDLAGKTQNLGGSVADILKGVLGGTLGGAGSGGITEKEQSAPAPRTGKSPEKALKELGKELEKEFKNTLEGLFGR